MKSNIIKLFVGTLILIAITYECGKIYSFREWNKLDQDTVEIKKLEKIYDIGLFKYKNGNSLANKIYDWYNTRDSTAYLKYLKKAIVDQPSDLNSIIKLVEYSISTDEKGLEVLLEQAKGIQEDYYKVNFYQACHSLSNGELSKAKKHLNKAYHPWHKYEYSLLESIRTIIAFGLDELKYNEHLIDVDMYKRYVGDKWLTNTDISNIANTVDLKLYEMLPPEQYIVYLSEHLEPRFRYRSLQYQNASQEKLTNSEIQEIMEMDLEREFLRRKGVNERVDLIYAVDSITMEMRAFSMNKISSTSSLLSTMEWSWCLPCEK